MYSVAIVGRPNVGKSTLFNRITESREAITSSESGITRDRRYGEGIWNGKRFRLIDTGGYVRSDADVFSRGIRAQVKAACDEASHIWFVVDSHTGMVPLDEDMAHFVRRLNKTIWVVANKADSLDFEQASLHFHALGIGHTVFALSAINGRGTGELLDALSARIDEAGQHKEDDGLPKVALIGRPNVGKSSLLNTLLGEERSLVSQVAGTTRDAIDTRYERYGKHLIWVDTAGIRKRSKQNNAIEYYSVLRSLRAMESSDVSVVVIDATEGLCAQDMHVLREAHTKKKGLVLAVNKWDLIEKETGTFESYKAVLSARLGDLAYVPMVFTSAFAQTRIMALVDRALAVYAERNKRIATSRLNTIMGEEWLQHPPPSQKGKIVRIKYMTQARSASPQFVAFANHAQNIPKNYARFLIGRLRHHFGFEGVPIQLRFRAS